MFDIIKEKAGPAGECRWDGVFAALSAYPYRICFRDGEARMEAECGPQCEKVTGYAPAEYAREPELWLNAVHPDDRQAVKNFLGFLSRMRRPAAFFANALCNAPGEHASDACTGEAHQLEYRIVRKDGAVRRVANRCVAVYGENGEAACLEGMVADVTGHAAAEGGLARRREVLPLAEAAYGADNPFASFVVHDVRTPVSSVITYLKLLERQCKDGDFGGVNEVFRRVIGINEILLKQVDDCLTVSRLRSGELKVRKRFFETFALIQRAISYYRLQAEMKMIELRCTAQPGLRLYADFNLAYEVVCNLISNAIKFCDKGNIITVSARMAHGPVITVANDGPPIDSKMLPNLFSFEAATSTIGTAGERGTGLGLPLAAEIMRLQGGELRAMNGEVAGCSFEAEFPPKKPVVLVVDNDDVDRFTMKGLLSLIDVEVIAAVNGKDALRVIEDHEVHLIISDIVMPVMDGYEFLKVLHEDKRYQGIQFIALTGYAQSAVVQKVLGMGVDDFIRKPIEPDDLLMRVRRFVA